MRKMIVLISIISVYAQPSIEWQDCLGGSGFDEGYSITKTSDNGFVVAGETGSNDCDVTVNNGDTDYWVVKLTSSGSIEWQRSYGGSNYDRARSVSQTCDGGFIIAGESWSDDGDVGGNYGGYDYWVIKTDSIGLIEFEKHLGGGSVDIARSIQQTSDGGFVVAGESYSNDYDVSGNHGWKDYWIVKLDSTGSIIWQHSLGGTSDDHAYSIQQTMDGGYIVTGDSKSNDFDVSGHHGTSVHYYSKYDFWVAKLDSLGSLEWQNSFGGIKDDRARSIIQTSDLGYAVAGFSYSNDGDLTHHYGTPGDSADFWIVKLDSLGIIEWQRTLGGNGNDEAYSILEDYDGGYVIAGRSNSVDGDVTANHGRYDYWIVKLDLFGILQWQLSLGGSNRDYCYAMDCTPDTDYVLLGSTYSNDCDVSGKNGLFDYWVVKLLPDTVSFINDKDLPITFSFSTHPNPFNSAVKIRVRGVEDSRIRVEVFDIDGRMVARFDKLTDRNAEPVIEPAEMTGAREFIWSPGESVGSGVYLVRAIIDDKIVTKRIVYLK